jgi:hypothetical protein
MTETVGKLRRELGETERTQSRMATTMQRLKGLGGIAAGIVGAGMTLKQPISQQMDFDSELHRTANFLYRDQGEKGRIAGVGTIRNNIYSALEYGGGNRDEALAAAEVMARSKMNTDQVYAALPEVMKVHSATGAGAEDVASLMTANYNFGLTGKESTAALDAATTASQHGKADVPLLAREAPRGLENARGAGFTGKKGYADVMALYEVAAAIAGTPEEGATNVNDLMTELSSANLANNASRVKIHGKKIDFKSMATHDATEGHNALYTLQHIIAATDDNDKKMSGWRKELASTTDPTRKESLQRAIDEEHRQHVGLFLRNQQSANAYLGYERNKDQYQTISDDIQKQFDLPEGQRSTDVDYAVMKDTGNYKTQQFDNEKQRASDTAVKPVADALGNLAGKVAELAVEFPKVAVAAEGAAIAISALGAAALLKTGYGVLAGAKGGGLIKRLLTKGGSVVEGTATGAGEAAEVTGEAVADSEGLLKRIFSLGKSKSGQALSAGKRVVTNGVLEDGLLSLPGVDVLTGLLYPSDTVSGSDESSELNRLKQRNLRRNQQSSSSDALAMLQNWPGHNAPTGNSPVINLPAQPVPAVNVMVQLDSHDIAAAIQVLIEKNSRRHGA